MDVCIRSRLTSGLAVVGVGALVMAPVVAGPPAQAPIPAAPPTVTLTAVTQSPSEVNRASGTNIE